MRVVVLANPHVPCHPSQSSGMERSTYELTSALAARGDLDVTIAAHPDTAPPRATKLLPWSVDSCPEAYSQWGDGASKWTDLAIVRAFFNLIPQLAKFDVVHDNTSSFVPPVALGWHLPRLRCIKTLRLMPYHPSSQLSRNSPAVRCFLTAFQRDAAREDGPVVREVPQIPRAREKPKPQVGNSTRVALSVGRVEPRKGHHVALEIARELALELVVCGSIVDVEYAAQLRAAGARIANLLTPGILRASMRSAAALLWTPVVPEPNGRVVWEALTCGLPVIGIETGALADLRSLGLAHSVSCAGYDLVRAEDLAHLPVGYDSVAARYVSIYGGGT